MSSGRHGTALGIAIFALLLIAGLAQIGSAALPACTETGSTCRVDDGDTVVNGETLAKA